MNVAEQIVAEWDEKLKEAVRAFRRKPRDRQIPEDRQIASELFEIGSVDQFSSDGRDMLASTTKLVTRLINPEYQRSDPPTMADRFAEILNAVTEKQPKLRITTQIDLLHEVRMELSRHELEIDVLKVVASRAETAELALAGLVSARQIRETSSVAPGPLNENIRIGNAGAMKKGATASREGNSDHDETSRLTIEYWQKIVVALNGSISATNEGRHVMQTDPERIRNTNGMTSQIVRLLENLTDIWVKYVDVELNLPTQGGKNSNPYIKFIIASLKAAGEDKIMPKQVLNIALKTFRPTIRANDQTGS